MSIEGTAAE